MELTFRVSPIGEDRSLPDALGIPDARAMELIRAFVTIMARDEGNTDEDTTNIVIGGILAELSHYANSPQELAYIAFLVGTEVTGDDSTVNTIG